MNLLFAALKATPWNTNCPVDLCCLDTPLKQGTHAFTPIAQWRGDEWGMQLGPTLSHTGLSQTSHTPSNQQEEQQRHTAAFVVTLHRLHIDLFVEGISSFPPLFFIKYLVDTLEVSIVSDHCAAEVSALRGVPRKVGEICSRPSGDGQTSRKTNTSALAPGAPARTHTHAHAPAGAAPQGASS